MCVHWNAFPSPSFSIQKSISNQQMKISVRMRPLSINQPRCRLMTIQMCPEEIGCQCQSQKCCQCWACWISREWWYGWKCADLIRAILDILNQVLRNLYRVLGLWGWDTSTKNPEEIQPPDFQSPYILYQIRIIQHPWELIYFKWWGTHLCLWSFDRSNGSGMYIGLKGVINWGMVLNCGHP